MSSKKVLIAAPRGYCAGVDRAIITVEQTLDLYGAPVYVRKQIVHNKHVVEDLEARGVVFVEELDEVPVGSTVVFSAHGVSPAVHAQAAQLNLKTIVFQCTCAGLFTMISIPFMILDQSELILYR